MSLHISTTSLNVIALLIASASLVKMTTLIPFAGELAQITVRLSDALAIKLWKLCFLVDILKWSADNADKEH